MSDDPLAEFSPEILNGADYTLKNPPPDWKAAVARLAKLPPIEYDQCRQAEADKLGGIRVSVLDDEVKKARGEGNASSNLQGRALRLDPPETWPEPVDGAVLLGELAEFFARHAHLMPGAAVVLGIWSVHTHCFERARHTPRLAITSPEKGCDKTTVLDLLLFVCCRPLSAANISTAAMFRTIEAAKPALLVDEADSFLSENEELRGALNAGHKRGGQVVRCVGENAEPRTFGVFAPAALAAIGKLPATIADRSIAVPMRKATRLERPQPIRRSTEKDGAVLARKAARWCADNAEALTDAEPVLPEWMANRVADNWRILFAIAAAAGGDWPERLARAAKALSGGDDGRESLGVALLADVRAIFDETGAERLATAEIVRRLVAMDDRPWPELPNNGKPLTAARFTRMLARFEVERQQWRTPGGTDDRVWGFRLDAFADAFARYLDPLPADPPGKTGDMVTRQANSEGKQRIKSQITAVEKLVTGASCHQFGNGSEEPANPQESSGFAPHVTMSPVSEGSLGERVYWNGAKRPWRKPTIRVATPAEHAALFAADARGELLATTAALMAAGANGADEVVF